MSKKKENPRPAAVALHYTGQGAPRVTAKGEGVTAERIVAVAKEHGVPISENRELAGLLSQIGLGEEIPPLLYVAVAEVLSFAYSLSGKYDLDGLRAKDRH